MKRLKLVFRPWWDHNPYQPLLADHLTPLGVRIDGITRWAELDFAHPPDIVHLHWLHPIFMAPNAFKAISNLFKFFGGLIVLRLRGTKFVWTAHNLQNHEQENLWVDRICSGLVAHLVHRIIVHGDAARHDLVRTFWLRTAKKIFVVPHGNYVGCYENTITTSQAREKLGLADHHLVFLFLGSIRPYKGVLELISAFKQLNDPDVRLVIAGEPSAQTLSAQIYEGIRGRNDIQFIPGFIPDEQIQVYLNACDLAVFPYRNILTSGSVLLAMSFGRACIAPRQGCIAETLDEASAFLYDPDHPSGLVDAMQRAIQKRAELSQMGRCNYQRAERWSWSRVAEMTLTIYKGCLR